MRYSRASLASQRLQVQHNPNTELQLLNAIWLLACWSAVLPKLFSLKFYTFKCISALTDGLFHHRERQFVCVYSGCLIAQHTKHNTTNWHCTLLTHSQSDYTQSYLFFQSNALSSVMYSFSSVLHLLMTVSCCDVPSVHFWHGSSSK